ncbi:pentatricopeptide repeat-containing protein At2g44880 [Curcuma longa]|uniref:pentatricopeptide repeat-containing protein At2g44880 n=1 Tax=Curcuma longa TaxID=136217 RepID=UPI003D9F5C21
MGFGREGELWTHHEKRCFHLLQRTPSLPAAALLQIQASLLRRGAIHANLSLLTRLITAFSDLAALASPIASESLLRHARRLFDACPEHDAFICSSFLRALSRNRGFRESIALYRDLLTAPPANFPDDHTFPSLLKACASLTGDSPEHGEGPQIHAHVVKMGFGGNAFASTALVDMYAKHGDMASARKVFDDMPHRSLPSWTSMTVGYARSGDVGAAIDLFQLMPDKDTAAVNAMIDVFVKRGDMVSARRLFDETPDRNVITWTNLISGYCKLGDMDAARALFDEMPERNLHSWNTMIGGYCQNRQPQRSLKLFRELQSGCCPAQPDAVTLVSVLPAVTDLGAIDLGRWIHNYARRNGLDRAITVSTALIDMYAKCGDIGEARRVFDQMPRTEPPAWNSMIYGLALNGRATDALNLFNEMRRRGVRPNEVTAMGVLSACNHGGLVDEAKRWFDEMEELHIERRIDHYGCMVDLLGRSGFLEEAEKLMSEMPCLPNGIILSSLLNACVIHGDVERAERALRKANEVEPWNTSNYVMMRNLYARLKRWGDVERIKGELRRFGGKREAGCSVIEVANYVWEFVSGDQFHPEWKNIYSVLGEMLLLLQNEGREEEEDWELELDALEQGPCTSFAVR